MKKILGEDQWGWPIEEATHQMDDLIKDALSLALKAIQDEIGVKTGDFASVYFSGSRWQQLSQIMKDYIEAELKNKEQ
jgi:hypothetical protein